GTAGEARTGGGGTRAPGAGAGPRAGQCAGAAIAGAVAQEEGRAGSVSDRRRGACSGRSRSRLASPLLLVMVNDLDVGRLVALVVDGHVLALVDVVEVGLVDRALGAFALAGDVHALERRAVVDVEDLLLVHVPLIAELVLRVIVVLDRDLAPVL